MKAPDEFFERDAKLDGLGIAFFSILSAMLDEMADVHPEGAEVVRRIRSTAVDMATSVSDRAARDVDALVGAAIRGEALSAINMVFAGTRVGRSSGRDDGGDEGGPGAG